MDIFVNNAGINVFSDPLALTDDEWQRCMSIDLLGVWHCCQAVLPQMILQQSGSIINIASVHSHHVIASTFPYPVAKHGLIGLTKSLGVDYGKDNIRVNAIAPGMIDTPLADVYFETCADPVAERKRQAELYPLKRIGKPEEVAMTAVFLGSDEAPFINATTITIDGGRSVIYHD